MSEASGKISTGSGLKQLVKLYRFLRPYRWKFALGLMFLLFSTAASLMFPKLLGDMVDIANRGLVTSEIHRTGLLLLAILTGQALFSYTRTRLFCLRHREDSRFNQAAYI